MMSMSRQDFLDRYGYEMCPNPVCARAWHGLPIVPDYEFFPPCPGSWAYEQERKADV